MKKIKFKNKINNNLHIISIANIDFNYIFANCFPIKVKFANRVGVYIFSICFILQVLIEKQGKTKVKTGS
jgi:hypothetical protein